MGNGKMKKKIIITEFDDFDRYGTRYFIVSSIIEEELTSILSEEIAKGIDKEILKRILSGINEKVTLELEKSPLEL